MEFEEISGKKMIELFLTRLFENWLPSIHLDYKSQLKQMIGFTKEQIHTSKDKSILPIISKPSKEETYFTKKLSKQQMN